jgi:hypothetical protein
MMFRSSRVLLVLIPVLLLMGVLSAYAQSVPQLELALVGKVGEYVAPAGQVTKLQLEILNRGPGDVYLVQGEVYVDPDLSGNWQLIHSEDTGNFHLKYLESALWTFDLNMPSAISAHNQTNGFPQVGLLIKIIYSTSQGEQSASSEFELSVPGASVQGNYTWLWFAVSGTVAGIVAMALVYRRISRRHSGNAKSA